MKLLCTGGRYNARQRGQSSRAWPEVVWSGWPRRRAAGWSLPVWDQCCQTEEEVLVEKLQGTHIQLNQDGPLDLKSFKTWILVLTKMVIIMSFDGIRQLVSKRINFYCRNVSLQMWAILIAVIVVIIIIIIGKYQPHRLLLASSRLHCFI